MLNLFEDHDVLSLQKLPALYAYEQFGLGGCTVSCPVSCDETTCEATCPLTEFEGV